MTAVPEGARSELGRPLEPANDFPRFQQLQGGLEPPFDGVWHGVAGLAVVEHVLYLRSGCKAARCTGIARQEGAGPCIAWCQTSMPAPTAQPELPGAGGTNTALMP
jgi:hypothetical protein